MGFLEIIVFQKHFPHLPVRPELVRLSEDPDSTHGSVHLQGVACLAMGNPPVFVQRRIHWLDKKLPILELRFKTIPPN